MVPVNKTIIPTFTIGSILHNKRKPSCNFIMLNTVVAQTLIATMGIDLSILKAQINPPPLK